jgi:ATP adenylyltransferase
MTRVQEIPFEHFLIRLPTHASADHVYTLYQMLLLKTKNALRNANAGSDYNVVLVSEWLLLIPRTSKGHGSFMANAANMVGLIMIKSDVVREEVLKMSLLDTLADLGIRRREISPST